MPAATVVILLGHLFVFAYLHAKCASDPPEKHLTGAPIPFPGLPGYEYFGFSSLRAELLKNASTSTVAIKKNSCFKARLPLIASIICFPWVWVTFSSKK